MVVIGCICVVSRDTITVSKGPEDDQRMKTESNLRDDTTVRYNLIPPLKRGKLCICRFLIRGFLYSGNETSLST